MHAINLDEIDKEPVKERFFDLDASVFLFKFGSVFGPITLYFTDKDHWVVQVGTVAGVDSVKVKYCGFTNLEKLIKSGLLRDPNIKTYGNLITVLKAWKDELDSWEGEPPSPRRVKAFDLLKTYTANMQF